MQNEISAVIFDLDGVITCTDEYSYLSWKRVAEELNLPFNREINEKFRGISRFYCAKILLKNHTNEITDELVNTVAEMKNKIYQEYLEKMTGEIVSNDVKHTLNELKKRGYKLAVGSSSKNAPFILKKIGYFNFFDAIADGNQIKNSKPDPEVFLLAAKKLDKDVSDCIIVGDAEVDMKAAKAGNFKSASISYASKIGLGDYQLNKLSDLLKILPSLNKSISIGL